MTAAAVAAATAAAAAANRRREEERRRRQTYASKVLGASDAFRKGSDDAQKYIDGAYDDKALADIAREKELDLSFRSFKTLWFKKETPSPEKRDEIETLARGMLRDQFRQAAAKGADATAWFAAGYSSLIGNPDAADVKSVDKLGADALYRLGFEARIAREVSGIRRMDKYALTDDKPNPDRAYLRQALEQRVAQVADRLENDADKGANALIVRQKTDRAF